MSDDDTTAFDTFDPADGDEPAPEFVEELLGQLEARWHSRADGHGTDPSSDPIDVAVFDQGNEPMGRNRLTAIIAAAAAIVVVIVGLVVITNDDDDPSDVDSVEQPDTTDPPQEEAAPEPEPEPETEPEPEPEPEEEPEPPEPDWSFDITYIDVDAGNGVAANEDFAWVVGDGEGQLSTIDLASNTVVSTADLPAGSQQAWYAFGSVWIGNDDGSLARFDPDAGEIIATIEVGDGRPGWLEADSDSVWHVNGGDAVRIDPASDTVVARIPVADLGGGIHFNADGVFVRDLAGTVHRIDPATDTVAASVPTPSGAMTMIASPGAVWAPGGDSGLLFRIDSATDSVVSEIDVSAAVGTPVTLLGVHTAGDSVFVRYARACEEGFCTDGIARIDPATDEVVAHEDLREDWGRSGMSAGPTTAWTFSTDAVARIDF